MAYIVCTRILNYHCVQFASTHTHTHPPPLTHTHTSHTLTTPPPPTPSQCLHHAAHARVQAFRHTLPPYRPETVAQLHRARPDRHGTVWKVGSEYLSAGLQPWCVCRLHDLHILQSAGMSAQRVERGYLVLKDCSLLTQCRVVFTPRWKVLRS